jgi:hypothetical protein
LKYAVTQGWKLVPLIVSVIGLLLLFVLLVGLIDVIVGGGGAVTTRLAGADVPPGGGSTTYREYVPAARFTNTENWVWLGVLLG